MENLRKKLAKIYRSLPSKLKNYKHWTLFRSIAIDPVLLIDIEERLPEAVQVAKEIERCESDANIGNLVKSLDAYYLARRDTGRWEKYAFDLKLERCSVPPIFIMSYNRWERNATLERMEFWNDQEVFENTFVFVQSDQKVLYEKNHPKFYYYACDVNSVGERMMKILEFCKKWRIREAVIMEDDISSFHHIKKGGTESNGHLSGRDEDLGGTYMKYFANQGCKIMLKDDDVVLVGMRNRVMANNESTSIIGHHPPMKGGCPNMVYYVNVDRFYPIYKKIPAEHYSPQYDWAIQCAIVAAKKKWAMVTGIVKDEHVNSKSVIGFSGDREELAKQYIEYYGVADSMTYRRFKDTALQGVKIFYNKRNNERYDTLF